MELEIFPADPKNPSLGYTVRYRDPLDAITEWRYVAETEAVDVILTAVDGIEKAASA